MNFTITREALLKPLQVVSGVIEKRQTLPVLSNVLVRAEGDQLTLTGSDLEVELRASTPLEGAEGGEVTLPGRKFMDICRMLPDDALIQVRVEDDKATVRSGKSRFSLATLPASEFPLADTVTGGFEFEVPEGDLRELIERTQFCMANQDVRYYLNGMLFEVENGTIRTVATDGHRLAVCELPSDVISPEKRQVIVPRKGVIELARLLGSGDELCKVAFNSNQIRVVVGETVFTSKLVDGRFPDYERVLPKGGDKIVEADRALLKQALVRTSILSNEKYRGIRLQLAENRVRATVNNPEHEEAEEELEVAYGGEALEIGFNVAYLVDALNAVREETVVIELSDANSSALVHGHGDTSGKYVVMPMRL